MLAIDPYLMFQGNAEEAFNFYKSVFGGEFYMLQRFKDSPDAGKVAKNQQDMLMHVSLPVGKTVLMGTDSPDSMGYKLITGNNFYISVSTESKEETDKIFNGLSEGGKTEMPLQDTFWGAYFGMLCDKFGIHWMVGYDKNRKIEH